MLTGILRYRHFVLGAIASEYRSRYARSRLGLLWTVLHPLAQALTFAIVLSSVLEARLPGEVGKGAYPIYLLAGIAAWGLFSEIVTRSMTVFIDYGSAIKKISFPRLCLPMIVLGSALINHAILLLFTTVICIVLGAGIGPHLLLIPIATVVIAAFGLGLGVFLGIMNVFVRDVSQVMTIVLQIWFWMTPIVYPASIIPAPYQFIVNFNPMTSLVAVYQDVFLRGQFPDPVTLLGPIILSIVAVMISFVLFRRASPEIVDAL
ncbi:MAG: ABC transporter permease [Rhodospirillales bacterium]|jgi:lipopolysaccharide transport system permease protein